MKIAIAGTGYDYRNYRYQSATIGTS